MTTATDYNTRRMIEKQSTWISILGIAMLATAVFCIWGLATVSAIKNCSPPANWNAFGYFQVLSFAYGDSAPGCNIKAPTGSVGENTPADIASTAQSTDFGCGDTASIYMDNNVIDAEKVPDSPFSLKEIPIWPGAMIAFSHPEWAAEALKDKDIRTQYAGVLVDSLYYLSGNNAQMELSTGEIIVVTSDPSTLGTLPENSVITVANLSGYRYYAWQAQLEKDLEKASETGCLIISSEEDIDFEAFKDVDLSDKNPNPEVPSNPPSGNDVLPSGSGNYPPPNGDDSGGGLGPTATGQPEAEETPTPTADAVTNFINASGVLDFITMNEARKAYTGGANGAWFVFETPINMAHVRTIEGPYPEMLYDISPKGLTLYEEGWWLVTMAKQDTIPLAKVKVLSMQEVTGVGGATCSLDLRRWGYIEVRWSSRSNDKTTWWKSADGSFEVPWNKVYAWPCFPNAPTSTPVVIPPTAKPGQIIINTPKPEATATQQPAPTPFFIPGGGMIDAVLYEYIESGEALWSCTTTQYGHYSGTPSTSTWAEFSCFGVTYSVYPLNLTLLGPTTYVADYEVPPYKCVNVGSAPNNPNKKLYICPAE